MDGFLSKLGDVGSGVPQGNVLGPLCSILYTSESFYILEELIGYAGDSTLIAVVPSPGVRSRTVAETLKRDLGKVGYKWCGLSGMKSNAGQTKITIVSRQHSRHPQSPP